MADYETREIAAVLFDGGWRSTDSDAEFMQEYFNPETETESEFLDWLEVVKAELAEIEAGIC